jgi:hypothetical protein
MVADNMLGRGPGRVRRTDLRPALAGRVPLDWGQCVGIATGDLGGTRGEPMTPAHGGTKSALRVGSVPPG